MILHTITHLQQGTHKASIEQGELVSYQVGGYELIHQKGSPGWRSSDTEMFPVIGPLAEAGFGIRTDRGIARQDQHGLLRELPYRLVYQSDTEAFYRKMYKAGTEVRNSKFPEKSTQEWLSWPYDFVFIKKFRLWDRLLRIDFELSGEEGMPYMLGYHPAFKLYSDKAVVEIPEGRRLVPLTDILAVGSRAYELDEAVEVVLRDDHHLRIRTEGFGHFMLWTEVPNMLCIEPITHYPYTLEQSRLHEGFRRLQGIDTFRVEIGLI